MGMLESLFVFGSFAEGQAHHGLIKPYIIEKEPAYILGTVFRLEVGYPAYLAEGIDRIQGQLVRLDGPDVLSTLLDQYHGVSALQPELSLYTKLTRDAFVSGGVKAASVYALPREKITGRMATIANGDWESSMNQQAPLPIRMTERQRNYVRRLGASSGREIIPIDLELYRELIKLELVIDKGRRLALSALGRDVLRFLRDESSHGTQARGS